VPVLLSIPILFFVLMLQTTIVSTLPLLHGYADLILLVLVAWSLQERVQFSWVWSLVAGLMVGYVSALPMFVPVAGYLFVTIACRLLLRRVWQSPILVMFIVTFVGSLVTQFLALIVLIVLGYSNLPIVASVNQII